jgi:hypothetical protein
MKHRKGANRPPFPMSEPLILRDWRTPGRPLEPVPLKLPADRVAALQAQADRLGCSRGALARCLLLEGLERLEAAAA